MPNYIAGVGSLEPKLMIVGEAPGRVENAEGIPFVGPTGQILNDCLYKAGIHRNECYITNVVKYQPPFNDMSKLHLIGVSLEDSIKELWENEIKRLKPNCILAIGNYALEAIVGMGIYDKSGKPTGILDYRGSILTSRDGTTKCVPTVHPAALFSHTEGEDETKGGLSWTYLKLIEADIIRAVEESLTREIVLPARDLTIAHSLFCGISGNITLVLIRVSLTTFIVLYFLSPKPINVNLYSSYLKL